MKNQILTKDKSAFFSRYLNHPLKNIARTRHNTKTYLFAAFGCKRYDRIDLFILQKWEWLPSAHYCWRNQRENL